jgi:hypothetical protein
MMGFSPLVPAYGRDYKTRKAVVEDWNGGKDFQTPTGAYANKEDAARLGLKAINIRFKQIREVAVLKLNDKGEAK